MPAAKNVERQIAVAIVIPMEETAFLVAMERTVCHAEIGDNPLCRLLMGIQE